MKLIPRKSGESRVTLRVEHYLSKEDLIACLYADVSMFELRDELPYRMPEAEIIQRVKKTLQWYGEDRLTPEDRDEDYWDWCTEQIERIVR